MLRIENNSVKKALLNPWVPKGSRVLDVGCGQGGDVHKWNGVGVSELVGIDPNPWAIREARRRSKIYDGFTFSVGDVRCAPSDKPFDVICYNFSLQYQPLELLPEVTRRLSRGGGLFLGVVTDSTRLEHAKEQGIQVERTDENHIRVFIPDTPYYANGPLPAPILHKEEFIREAERLGLELQVWEPFSMYAKFVFRYNIKT
jgi:ubiquinone/menaquinone biosynthesis C-methylase UbiE